MSINSQYSQQWDMGDVLEKMIWLAGAGHMTLGNLKMQI